MVADAIPSRSLQDSLAQLARSFQTHEATISIGHIAECLEHLPISDRSALDRLFSLIHQNVVGVADVCVSSRQMRGADSESIGTYKHQWPTYLLNVCPTDSWSGWSAAAARIRGRIGLAGKRTIANRRLSAFCQTEEKYRQRIFAECRCTIRDHLCRSPRRPARNSAKPSSAVFPAITVLGRG
jgi:hypothetical protein